MCQATRASRIIINCSVTDSISRIKKKLGSMVTKYLKEREKGEKRERQEESSSPFKISLAESASLNLLTYDKL